MRAVDNKLGSVPGRSQFAVAVLPKLGKEA